MDGGYWGSSSEKLSRLREEDKKHKYKLKSHDERIETLVDDTASFIDKVINLKARACVAKEYLKEAEFVRDNEIARAAEEVVVKFKQSEELVILLKKINAAGYNVGYDVGVEEIFFNIWVKRRDINYRFLGGELVKLMDQWLKEERLGTLKTTPPPSPLDQMIKGNVVAAEVGPSEVPK